MAESREPPSIDRRPFIRTIWLITAITVAAGVVETAAGYGLGSHYLVKDGLEWGYGAAIYGLSLLTIGRGPSAERWGGYAIAAILAVGGVQSALEILDRLRGDGTPDAASDLYASTGTSLVVSVLVAAIMARFRADGDPVITGSWYQARNDAISSLLDVAVAVATAYLAAGWLQTGSDLVSMILAFQSAWIVAVEAARTSR